MFKKSKYYCLSYVNSEELILEDENNNIIHRIDLININNEDYFDYTQVSYLISKILTNIDNSDFLFIRIISENSLTRTEFVESLTPDESTDYFEYNKKEILPYDTEHLKIKCDYWNNQLLIYGIENSIYEIFTKKINDLDLKKVYVTLLESEIITYLVNNKAQNMFFIYVTRNIIHYITITEGLIKFSKCKINDRLSSSEINKVLKNDNYINYNIYLSGDLEEINKIYGDLLYKDKIELVNLNKYIKNYFGV